MKIFYIFLIFCFSNYIKSQDLKNSNFIYLENHLSLIAKDKNHIFILSGVNRAFVLIQKEKSKILKLEYEINNNEYILKDICYLKTNKYFKKVFKKKNFKYKYIDYKSDFFKDKEPYFRGANLSFVLINKNKEVITEVHVTAMLDILPYEKNIHYYILTLFGTFGPICELF
jgi:hypothetical protein